MNTNKILKELENLYPGKKIVKNPEDNPTEILCETEPTEEHADYSVFVAIIDKTLPHYHEHTKEVYEVAKGTLTVMKGKKEFYLIPGDSLTIIPGEIHSAKGQETWIKVTSYPGWTKEDHILI